MAAASDWLGDAVIYEIYPQTFADSDCDGVGDLPGVLAHLDHLAWLGVNTIWFNPCFASPFADAGYDVSDYLRVAPRYGTNDDLVAVVDAARERGIRVLLDLVAGHTSTEHAWFQEELHASGPDPLGDRYIWWGGDLADLGPVDVPGRPAWVRSPGPRPGFYVKNYYDAQPALNFGYARQVPGEPWREPVDAPGPLRNRQALRDVMAFWLDRGIAGFRVDMAFWLVKDDPGFAETTALWREMRAWLDTTYPHAVIVPEGAEPRTGLGPAFHADFFLVIHEPHSSLFNNGGAGRLFWVPDEVPCYFDAAGDGSTAIVEKMFAEHWAESAGRPVLMASSDHDFSRLACGDRTAEQLGAAFTFLLTWGSVPSIFAGDEIGVRYLPGMPAKEGSLNHPEFFNRGGARTPMQWDGGPNAGFSTAPADALYLPIDPDPDRPTVAKQLADEGSPLHLVRRLIALRREVPTLGTRAPTTVLHSDYPFVYRRGDSHLVVVNPRRAPADAELADGRDGRLLLGQGVTMAGGRVDAEGFGYGVFRLV